MNRKRTGPPRRPPSYTKPVTLVLQGGGALGSYQGGVYEALAGADYLPNWVAGISIGAINAALIAGNAPERRVERLRQFWEGITPPSWPPSSWFGPHDSWGEAWTGAWGAAGADTAQDIRRQAGAMRALLFGQPGFFSPRQTIEWFQTPAPSSFYDVSALKSTLERLVDFDRINSREIRFSVGAVNVETGNFAYFDNAGPKPIRAEHIMASGALPTGFPAIEIDGEYFWDGGLVSNTPLQYVLDDYPRRSRLAFQVDLFPARGKLPDSIQAAQEREKDIRYSSRTRAGTDKFKTLHDVRHAIDLLWAKLPPELRATPEAQLLHEFGCLTNIDIVQLIDRTDIAQGQSKDYEFSRPTMEIRWAQGLADARATVLASPWLMPMPPELGARTFDVLKPAHDRAGVE